MAVVGDTRARTAARPRPPAAAVRLAILDATVRIIGRAGVAAVTHRAVAAEAGVSLSSTTYHFASKDEIIGEALRRVAAIEIESAAQDAAGFAARDDVRDPASFAELLLDWLCPQLEGERLLTVRAGYHLQLEAAHRAELRAIHRAWTARVLDVAQAALTLCGAADPPRDAHILATMIDGLRLEQLTDPQPRFRERARPLLVRLVTALAD